MPLPPSRQPPWVTSNVVNAAPLVACATRPRSSWDSPPKATRPTTVPAAAIRRMLIRYPPTRARRAPRISPCDPPALGPAPPLLQRGARVVLAAFVAFEEIGYNELPRRSRGATGGVRSLLDPLGGLGGRVRAPRRRSRGPPGFGRSARRPAGRSCR